MYGGHNKIVLSSCSSSPRFKSHEVHELLATGHQRVNLDVNGAMFLDDEGVVYALSIALYCRDQDHRVGFLVRQLEAVLKYYEGPKHLLKVEEMVLDTLPNSVEVYGLM